MTSDTVRHDPLNLRGDSRGEREVIYCDTAVRYGRGIPKLAQNHRTFHTARHTVETLSMGTQEKTSRCGGGIDTTSSDYHM